MWPKKKTILLIESYQHVRRIMKKALRDMGFEEIIEADDGESGWYMLNTHDVDLVLCEWVLPKLSGIDLLRRIRNSEAYSCLPFIMVTGEACRENILEAFTGRVSGYVIKPFSPRALHAKIERIFAAPPSDALSNKSGIRTPSMEPGLRSRRQACRPGVVPAPRQAFRQAP